MNIKTIKVPIGKCPLDILSEQGEKIQNSRIFMHDAVVKDLVLRAASDKVSYYTVEDNLKVSFYWPATDTYPETSLTIQYAEGSQWAAIVELSAADIPFSAPSMDAEICLFLEMEEQSK